MITLITGVPGSGKTLRAVWMIKAERAKGRAVYSDIDGLDPSLAVLPAPLDWRDTPEGSFVVYDEAQKTYPSTGKPGQSQDPRIQALQTHRHTGHDIVYLTQSPTLIHHDIRKLVGLHVHVHRAAGLKRATLFTWDFAVQDPNDRREQERADTENWFYPKDLFKLYKSATIHTHKFNVPKKIAAALVVVALIAVYYGGRLWSNGGLSVMTAANAGEKTAAVGSALAPTPSPLVSSVEPGREWTQAPVLPRIAGCALLSKSCRCWNTNGDQLDLTDAQCMNFASGPLPLSFSPSGASVGVSPVGTAGVPPAATPLPSR